MPGHLCSHSPEILYPHPLWGRVLRMNLFPLDLSCSHTRGFLHGFSCSFHRHSQVSSLALRGGLENQVQTQLGT